jgi:transcriptional regulator with XRE-family HTH domain
MIMIAEKIKALRTAHNLTQAELARKLGVTRNGVNSWEQGLSIPSTNYIVELSKLFGVSTDYLLGISEQANINVAGLNAKDVALLSELASRLRGRVEGNS